MNALRVLLGGLLLLTGFLKVGEEEALAETLAIHGLLPGQVNHLVAVLVPWAELWTGALLLVGLWTAPATLVAVLLFAAFQLVTGAAIARGLEVGCGCFGKDLSGMPLEALYLIDLAGLASAVVVLVGSLPPAASAAPVTAWKLAPVFVILLVATWGGGFIFRMLERSTWGGEPRNLYWTGVVVIALVATAALAVWKRRTGKAV